MAVQQVGRIDRLAAHLGVEIEAAGREAAGLQDVIERRDEFGRVVGELVGVPARLVVVAVGVDRAENAERGGRGDLVLEAEWPASTAWPTSILTLTSFSSPKRLRKP